MANGNKQPDSFPADILTPEQAALVDLYIQSLDTFLENIKTSEKIQVEIETLHLKKILTA